MEGRKSTAVEALLTTTKMAAADVERAVVSAIEAVLHGETHCTFRFLLQNTATLAHRRVEGPQSQLFSAASVLSVYNFLIAQCCITLSLLVFFLLRADPIASFGRQLVTPLENRK